MKQIFYPIQIVGVEKPIEEARTLSLKIPENLQDVFKFRAGQHLKFCFKINGEEVERTYSLNNSPFEKGNYQVTVKIKSNGLVSNYISENIKVGDTVMVSSPEGNFTVQPVDCCSKTYYFFAAGSGITPIFSMIKTILLNEPNSKVNLLYGNRNVSDIIFYGELNKWMEKYPDKFNVKHALSKRFLDLSLIEHEVKRGRISDDMLVEFINEFPSKIIDSEYYVCGPGSMNQMVFDTLTELGVPAKLIHYEYFSAEGVEYDEVYSKGNVGLNAIIRKQEYQVVLEENETVLQGLKRIGAPVPFSCQNGICGTCKASLLEGEVQMKASMALSKQEIDNNMVLTCQSLAQSSKIKVDYD